MAVELATDDPQRPTESISVTAGVVPAPDLVLPEERVLESVLDPIRISQVFIRPVHLERAWAHQLNGDAAKAHDAFDSARVILEDLLVEDQEDYRVHGALAFVYAGLGRSADAATAARAASRAT